MAIAATAGCSAACKGPGCEDSWPTGRIAVHRGDSTQGVRVIEAWDGAQGGFDGDGDGGSSWWVTSAGDTLYIGQPDADRVARTADQSTLAALTPDWLAVGPGNTEFGASVVAIQQEGEVVLVVGAPGDDFARGAVYVLRGSENGGGERTVLTSELALVGASPGDQLGTRLTRCGDVTGDGVDDLAVSIPWFTQPNHPDWPDPDSDIPVLAGAVLLVSGVDLLGPLDANRPVWELGRLWWGTEPGEGAGTSVACERDLSGDGIADVVVGSPWAQGTTGRITLHLGGTGLLDDGPLDQSAARTMDGPDEGGWFGIAITSFDLAGQVLVAVGSAGAAGGEGRVHAYPARAELANPARLIPRRRATFDAPSGRSLPDHFGRWLAAGDLDGDGEGDLIIGAPDYKLGNDGFDAGRTWVFMGGEAADWDLTTAAEDATWQIEGTHAFERTGRAPHVSDLDNDGVDDLVLPLRSAPDPT